ncbi:hypothetical protein [Dubosiella newyorkensis]|nr:hypothetical protein [Dubosiella newyorkensis]
MNKIDRAMSKTSTGTDVANRSTKFEQTTNLKNRSVFLHKE